MKHATLSRRLERQRSRSCGDLEVLEANHARRPRSASPRPPESKLNSEAGGSLSRGSSSAGDLEKLSQGISGSLQRRGFIKGMVGSAIAVAAAVSG